MKNKQGYLEDITEIRSMMVRSSKFLSVSGLAGVMAGIYALIGAYSAHTLFGFRPQSFDYAYDVAIPSNIVGVFWIGIVVLLLALSTAFALSYRKAKLLGEPFWTSTSRNLLISGAFPLAIGGMVVLLFYTLGLVGLIVPFTMIFYGLALFGAGSFTYREIRILGVLMAALGIIASFIIPYSLLLWALGFGALHIVYGTYIYLKHEK